MGLAEGAVTAGGDGASFWRGWWNVLESEVVVAQLCECTICHGIVKWISSTEREVQLNKTEGKKKDLPESGRALALMTPCKCSALGVQHTETWGGAGRRPQGQGLPGGRGVV